jgi:hypothetical protein
MLDFASELAQLRRLRDDALRNQRIERQQQIDI